MIFPFVEEELEEEDIELEEDESEYMPREYGVDFETGKLTGKIVEGMDAVLIWAWLALQTSRERYYVYSLDYGQDYEDMLGRGYTPDYITAEMKRMTEECLYENPFISDIENFICDIKGEKVTLSFRLLTDFGESEEVEVVV